MTREDAADILNRIALLLELKGENPFKIRAYKSGAEVVESYAGDIMQLAADNKLAGIKGIGDALRDKLHEMATTGKLEFFEKRGEAAKISGFGDKTVVKILESIAFRAEHASEFRIDQVYALALDILDTLRAHPAVSRAEVCGSFRRGKETVHDLDFLVSTRKPEQVIADFVALPQIEKVIVQGGTKASVYAPNGVQCDLRAVSSAEFPFALNYFTGSKEHNVVMRQRALDRGLSLNEYGFTPTEAGASLSEAIQEIHDERDIYRALGLDYIEPELRENSGEIEAAAQGRLPALIQLENLRGVFHNHTTASDGRGTLREMAEAARDLGLQYLGIADHSKSSFQANGLNEQRLRAQIAEIRAMNAEFDGHFRLFAGSEVDILKDGSLDFDDDLLAELDYCVASVHNVFNLPEADMTRRIIRAIENPHVTMLGHVTGRLLLQRPAYAVNIPAIIDAAAETGTIIEGEIEAALKKQRAD
ncbi:MAG: PHP domain-containing protein [Verrucomicrobia bacterium]|nr:PHP domain-containing protein [Verrucomicrobiota bacterium]